MEDIMEITIHRGTHQIGGCVTEIRNDKARIIIDVGSNLPGTKKLRKIPGCIKEITRGCNGVFVTHYHGDHIGQFSCVASGVDIYMGEASKKIFLSLQEALDRRNIKDARPDIVKSFITFKPGPGNEITSIPGMIITPILTDHSAYDAYMYLIKCNISNKTVLITGDFRTHGRKGASVLDTLSDVAKNVDVLITEGTMLSRENKTVKEEKEFAKEVEEFLNENKNVFLLCSSMNIDTIAQFYNTLCERHSERPFIVAEKDLQNAILDIVAEHNNGDAYYDFNKQPRYSYTINDFEGTLSFPEDTKKLMKDDKGFCMLITANGIGEHALKKKKYHNNSVIVYSMWKGYLNKKHSAFNKRIYQFIKAAEKRGTTINYDLHTSGHASPAAIEDVYNVIKPDRLIPFHCEDPEDFKTLKIPKEKIIVMNDEETYDVVSKQKTTTSVL